MDSFCFCYQLSHLESRLDELQKEKHQMFLQLKKVDYLNETNIVLNMSV